MMSNHTLMHCSLFGWILDTSSILQTCGQHHIQTSTFWGISFSCFLANFPNDFELFFPHTYTVKKISFLSLFLIILLLKLFCIVRFLWNWFDLLVMLHFLWAAFQGLCILAPVHGWRRLLKDLRSQACFVIHAIKQCAREAFQCSLHSSDKWLFIVPLKPLRPFYASVSTP